MRVVPYTPKHKDEMRAICLATASERARTSELHATFTLLMYCDPYLEHGTCYMLVDDDDVARGYVLCAEDWETWKPLFEPYAQKIRALSPEYEQRLAGEYAYFDQVEERFPAHLHIDIMEPWTGGGNGRLLMDTLLDHLREVGVRGISFGAAADNERAKGFYRHMGFGRLPGQEDNENLFCMEFARTA